MHTSVDVIIEEFGLPDLRADWVTIWSMIVCLHRISILLVASNAHPATFIFRLKISEFGSKSMYNKRDFTTLCLRR